MFVETSPHPALRARPLPGGEGSIDGDHLSQYSRGQFRGRMKE